MGKKWEVTSEAVGPRPTGILKPLGKFSTSFGKNVDSLEGDYGYVKGPGDASLSLGKLKIPRTYGLQFCYFSELIGTDFEVILRPEESSEKLVYVCFFFCENHKVSMIAYFQIIQCNLCWPVLPRMAMQTSISFSKWNGELKNFQLFKIPWSNKFSDWLLNKEPAKWVLILCTRSNRSFRPNDKFDGVRFLETLKFISY